MLNMPGGHQYISIALVTMLGFTYWLHGVCMVAV